MFRRLVVGRRGLHVDALRVDLCAPPSAAAGKELSAFPEAQLAAEAIEAGEVKDAIPMLHRVADVAAHAVGATAPMTFCARRRLLRAQSLAGDFSGAAVTMGALERAARESETPLLDRFHVFRAAAAFWLSFGSLGRAAANVDELLLHLHGLGVIGNDGWVGKGGELKLKSDLDVVDRRLVEEMKELEASMVAAWAAEAHMLGAFVSAAQGIVGRKVSQGAGLAGDRDAVSFHHRACAAAGDLERLEALSREHGVGEDGELDVGREVLEGVIDGSADIAVASWVAGGYWTTTDRSKDFDGWNEVDAEDWEGVCLGDGVQDCATRWIEQAKSWVQTDQAPQLDDNQHQNPNTTNTSSTIESPWDAQIALLHANWLSFHARTLLSHTKIGDKPSELHEQAAEHAKLAVSLTESLHELPTQTPSTAPLALANALATFALVHQKLGKAVTSEGLFRSAIDTFNSHHQLSRPHESAAHSTALRNFADLVGHWENRESEAKKLLQSLPPIVSKSIAIEASSRSTLPVHDPHAMSQVVLSLPPVPISWDFPHEWIQE